MTIAYENRRWIARITNTTTKDIRITGPLVLFALDTGGRISSVYAHNFDYPPVYTIHAASQWSGTVAFAVGACTQKQLGSVIPDGSYHFAARITTDHGAYFDSQPIETALPGGLGASPMLGATGPVRRSPPMTTE